MTDGGVRVIRPRRGDLEAATQPHPFRCSGEYVGRSRAEVCDLCGLVQRGTWIHPVEPALIAALSVAAPGGLS